MDQQLRKRRSFVAPLVTLLCAVVLAGGSCYGFLSTFNINGSGKHAALNVFFLIVFFSNVMAVSGAIVWIIVGAVRDAKSSCRARVSNVDPASVAEIDVGRDAVWMVVSF